MVLSFWSAFGADSSGVPNVASGREVRDRRAGERTGARRRGATGREIRLAAKTGGGRDVAFIRSQIAK